MNMKVNARFIKPGLVLVFICLIAAGLMIWAAWTDSAVNDEVAHIPAGYDDVHNLTYTLNPEHPPLVKALGSFPVLFLEPNFPTSSAIAPASPDDEWTVGSQFLYRSGNNTDELIRVARLAPIGITILTIIFIYLLSQMFMGPWWSLVPPFLFAFDPTILANGHYVTTDVGAAFGIVVATYYFLQHLRSRSRKSLWFAGVAFGIAQLTKFSTIILIPFFFLIYLIEHMRLGKKRRVDPLSTTEPPRQLLLDLTEIFLIGYGLVYLVYAVFMIHYPMAQQIADTTAALTQRLGGVSGFGSLIVWMAGNTVLRPLAQYLLGVVMVASHVASGTFVYAFGKVSWGSAWWYFPAIFALKTSIPALIIIATGIILAIAYSIKHLRKNHSSSISVIGEHKFFLVLVLVAFVVAYWYISIASPLDHGIRYLIPTFPFIYILAIFAISIWWEYTNVRSFWKYYVFTVLLCWVFLEAIFAAPYFLSYYNELAGGTWNGYHLATDSNYDWGQDMLRFQSFMDIHPEISQIAVGYLGRGDIHYYLGSRAIDWPSDKGNPANEGIHWFAMSIDSLEVATQPAEKSFPRNASKTYAWLTALKPQSAGMGDVPTPDYRVGTTIFIYHL